MAKKKSHRKHQFKHTAPNRAATTAGQAKPTTVAATAAAPVSNGAIPAYIGTDLRRIGLLAAVFIGLQVVLWYLFNHTGLGPGVYHLIKP